MIIIIFETQGGFGAEKLRKAMKIRNFIENYSFDPDFEFNFN